MAEYNAYHFGGEIINCPLSCPKIPVLFMYVSRKKNENLQSSFIRKINLNNKKFDNDC